RKLHPSDHDSLDAALGRRRRNSRAAPIPRRPERDRADRNHPADRHRQEKRNHDDRLRARGSTRRRQVAARRDLPGVRAALSPDHDDHDGRDARRVAARAGQRRRLRDASPAWHRDRWRTAREPGPDPLHDAGDLSVYGSAERWMVETVEADPRPPNHRTRRLARLIPLQVRYGFTVRVTRLITNTPLGFFTW